MLRLLALCSLLAPSALAQSGYGSQVSVLGVRAFSMGEAGAFLSDTDPLAFTQNPARLAAAAGSPMLRLSLDGHPNHQLFGDGEYDTSLGYLAATYAVGPGAVGVMASGLTDTFEATDSEGNPVASFDGGDRTVGIGGAVRLGDARAHLDVGATVRLNQLFYDGGLTVDGSNRDTRVTEPALDLGAIATVNAVQPRALRTGEFALTASVSAGYVQRGIGPDFDFGDEESIAQRVSQARTGSAGVSAQIGLDAQYAGGRVRLVGLDLAAESIAELNITRFEEFGSVVERSLFFGGIRVQDALLGNSSGERVEGQRGARLTLADALWLAAGRKAIDFDDSGTEVRTWGVGVSVGGALRAIGALQNDAGALALGQRFDLTLGMARGDRYQVRDGERGNEPFLEYRQFQIGGAVRL